MGDKHPDVSQVAITRSTPHTLTDRGRQHGQPRSWAFAIGVIAAFTVGGAAMILHMWWLMWLCVGVIVVSVPLGMVVRVMDDTMQWTHALPDERPDHPGPLTQLEEQHGGDLREGSTTASGAGSSAGSGAGSRQEPDERQRRHGSP